MFVWRANAAFKAGCLAQVFRIPGSKIDDDGSREAVFSVLHTPPSAHDINRTSWQISDLQRVLVQKGHRLSEKRLRRLIKAGGYRWRRARLVLTSSDAEYEQRLAAVKRILSALKTDEHFFSVDEYGPFAMKQRPRRRRIAPGEHYIIPQHQKSRGWLILTAALELSRNQVSHFYSRQKNTEEMIKMADLLRDECQDCLTVYLCWNAASWHISKKLVAHLTEVNWRAAEEGSTRIDIAPLPAGAQFLNVIESVFSGMSGRSSITAIIVPSGEERHRSLFRREERLLRGQSEPCKSWHRAPLRQFGGQSSAPWRDCGRAALHPPKRRISLSLERRMRTCWTLSNPRSNRYSIHYDQLRGPAWMDMTQFDLIANVPPGTTVEQFRKMLQNLLAERFRMQVHHEAPVVPVYGLTVAKNGPKLSRQPRVATRTSLSRVMGPPGGPRQVSHPTRVF